MAHPPATPKPKPTALRRRKTPAVVATAYVAVLAGAWITTCVLSFRTIRQSPDNSGAVTKGTAQTLDRVAFLIDVLNFIAAMAAMPVIYTLLARAAVVFSQRTSRKKTLSVRQLLALADRKFLRYCPGVTSGDGKMGSTRLAQLGALLILSALVLPPIRAILVHTDAKLFPEAEPSGPARFYANGWNSTLVGLDPQIRQVKEVYRRHVVERTRDAMINTFPSEWKATAWYNPGPNSWTPGDGYFATSLPKDTTTGMYRQHALRMHSTSSCKNIQPSEYPATCSGEEYRRLEASYDNANLTVKVCVPHMWPDDSPWNQTENRQDLAEVMYIGVSSPDDKYQSHTIQCTGQTSMGYFELGNLFNRGRFGPLLSSFEFPSNGKDVGEFTDEIEGNTYAYGSLFDIHPPILDYGSDIEYDSSFAPGPLALTAHALFGPGSFFHLAQSITQPDDTVSQILCRLSPIPLQRVFSALRRCEPDSTETDPRGDSAGPFASYHGWANDRVHSIISNILLEDVLSPGMYFANQAALEVATSRAMRSRNFEQPYMILHTGGIAVRTPVVSTAALAVVTVLVGLQVAGIAVLLWYIYTMPTWTGTLDTLAMAGITRQLAEREGGFLRSDGFWVTTEKELREMHTLDALMGVVDMTDREPGDSTPLSTASDEATVLGDASAPGPGYMLRVGAPGLISRRLQNPSKSSV